MVKNIVIVILAVAVVVEGGILVVKQIKSHPQEEAMEYARTIKPSSTPSAGPNARGGRQIIPTKGTNLKASPISQYAFQIAPGTLSDESKKALTGWNIVTKTQDDGSTLITLTPKDSDDQDQQYTIKTGQMLYFIEQTPSDDHQDQDKDLNYRDDYGIVTDMNGIIQ